MSWLDDEANDNKQKEATEQHQKEVLSRSQWWAAILACLEREVNAINCHEHWKKRLGDVGFPLRFGLSYGGDEHQISKSGYPAIMVAIQHKYDHVLVGRVFTENPLSRDFDRREKLAIATMGDQVVLVTDKKETLVVPEDAVRYILKAVIESLKITKPVP